MRGIVSVQKLSLVKKLALSGEWIQRKHLWLANAFKKSTDISMISYIA